LRLIKAYPLAIALYTVGNFFPKNIARGFEHECKSGACGERVVLDFYGY
jgi:hypothetical protein